MCITMEVGPRIAKPPLLQLQNLPDKGDGGWKKVSVSFLLLLFFCFVFCRSEDREFVEKMCFGASYSTSNKLLLVFRQILTMGLQKMPLKLAVGLDGSRHMNFSLSSPIFIQHFCLTLILMLDVQTYDYANMNFTGSTHLPHPTTTTNSTLIIRGPCPKEESVQTIN